MNSRIVAAFVSRILSMINLPRESVTATEIVAWWTSMPIYFSWLITALLSVGVIRITTTYRKVGAFYIACTHLFLPQCQRPSPCINMGRLPASFHEYDVSWRWLFETADISLC